MISKRQYHIIANTIKNAMELYVGSRSDADAIFGVAYALANKFKHDNPSFNYERFMKATGTRRGEYDE